MSELSAALAVPPVAPAADAPAVPAAGEAFVEEAASLPAPVVEAAEVSIPLPRLTPIPPATRFAESCACKAFIMELTSIASPPEDSSNPHI
jgi:hypothetical protein